MKLWDPRASSASLLTLDHGAPVESAIFLKNSSIIVSAGANYIRVWDILAGGKLMSSVSHHLKLITCIHYDAARNRILTGSLDKTVKILSAETFELDYGINYAAPVLSLALSPDHECLAVGMASGLLDIKLRTSEIDHETEKLKLSKSSSTASKKEIYPNSKEFFLRRGTSTDLPTETLRIAPKHKKLATHDKYLKRFQYKKALDHVVEKGTIIAIIGVMEEIRSRNAFEACFSHRTEQAILPFARFMLKHITNPNYSHLICAFCEIILDMNAKLLGQSSDFDEVFLKLSTRLHVELSLQRDIYGLLGAISLITANSSK